MTKVVLRESEVVLCNTEIGVEGESFSSAEFILTNERLIFKYRRKEKAFKWVDAQAEYDVSEIKVFNGIPQINQKASYVEIYFKNKQIELLFMSKKEAQNFVKKATELVTGKTAGVRTAEKIKDTIAVVDDTLGIDTVQVATSALKGGASSGGKGMFAKKSGVGKVVGFLAKGVEVLGGSMSASHSEEKKMETKTASASLTDNKIEELKKFKELLDAGIINEQEFTEKKKEILDM